MNEMVERVARALAKADGEPGWETCHEVPHYSDMARAAIEAMREPSEEMMEAPAFIVDLRHFGDDGSALDESGAKQCWQIMIDAALGEKP